MEIILSVTDIDFSYVPAGYPTILDYVKNAAFYGIKFISVQSGREQYLAVRDDGNNATVIQINAADSNYGECLRFQHLHNGTWDGWKYPQLRT